MNRGPLGATIPRMNAPRLLAHVAILAAVAAVYLVASLVALAAVAVR